MEYGDVIRDFSARTWRNLKTLEGLRCEGSEVFETTQLLNSMLGLIVFPREELVNRIPATPFLELQRDGWPTPTILEGYRDPTDLRDMIRYLRNSIAHFNLEFIVDDHREIKGLRVWNTRQNRGQKTWEAELSLSDLRGIAERFSKVISDMAV